MSSNDEFIMRLALALDGAIVGLGLALIAVQTWRSYNSTSSALHKIRDAPTIRISDLRPLLSSSSSSTEEFTSSSSSSSSDYDGKLVVVRGLVDAKSVVESMWRSLGPNVLVSHESGERAVVLQRTQTCIYHEWRGLLGWTSDIRALFGKYWKDQKITSLRMIPFVLVDCGQSPSSDYVVVNMDGSTHPLPLATVYHQLQPVQATPYTFLQAVFGHAYPVGLLDEEKVLSLGKEISAVGICNLHDGVPQIKSCQDLPFFLSEMTKNQMVVDLAIRTNILFWGGLLVGSLSVGILGYAAMRNWRRWKQWRQQRQQSRSASLAADDDVESLADEEAGEVPDGELCVICLMRRRRSAFVPCGHMVCCQRCALSVERDSAPKCPVCRQTIRSSILIFSS